MRTMIWFVFLLGIASVAGDHQGCWKDWHYRGMGRWKHGNCSESEESEAGLCFTKCPDNASGMGPFCWFSCPNEFEYSAGAMCCVNESMCKAKAVDLAVKIPTDIVHLVADRENPAKVIADVKILFLDATNIVMPSCTEPAIADLM